MTKPILIAGGGPAGLAATLAVVSAVLSVTCSAAGMERVTFASADEARTPITGYFLASSRPADQQKATPAVIAMHGCGGLFARGRADQLSSRHADWAERWTAAGYAVLLPDSFGSRGVVEVCTSTDRVVNPRGRASDALGAAAWLARQTGIDASRMALVGWSNGGSTVLWADDARRKPEAELRTVIAFYPGCRAVQRDPAWRPRVPLTILIGAADDWTPAEPCQSLADAHRFRIVQYPNAYHDFDSSRPPAYVRDLVTGKNCDGSLFCQQVEIETIHF